MRAWALLVVSSEQQAETLAYQRAWASETTAERGWTLERTFAGVSSGKLGPRKIVRDLLAELRDSAVKPDWLLMIRLDRLGREALECQVVLRDIHALGVKVWTRESGEVKGDSAMERLISTVKLYVGEQENEVRRDKLLARYKRKREAGLPVAPRRPYGLALGPDKRDVAVPDEAEAVRMVFQMRTEGISFYAIAQKLRAIAPPRATKTGATPMLWSTTTVKRMLQQRAYIGPVVDELAFARAQRNMGIERRPRKHVWELGGAPLYCFCGRTMHGNVVQRKGDPPEKAQRYYRCFGRQHNGWGRLARADALERQFAEHIAAIAGRPELIERYCPAPAVAPDLLTRARAAARKQLDDIDRQRAKVFDLNAAGKLRDEDLQERLDALAERRDALYREIADVERQDDAARNAARITRDAVAAIQSVAAEYPLAAPAERQTLVRMIASSLGGLCVEEDGTLTFRVPPKAVRRFG